VVPLLRGDRWVMCSDGLVDEVDDAEIERIANEHAHPQAAADAMVAAANASGGRDNTTVVVVDIVEGDDPDAHTSELEGDPTWAEPAPDRLIDAEPVQVAVSDIDPTDVVARPFAAASPPPAAPRRRGLGVLLFGVALAAILIATVTMVLVVRHNADGTTPTSTTPTSTTITSTTITSTTVTSTNSTPTSEASSTAP
jgi:hypothetical protein